MTGALRSFATALLAVALVLALVGTSGYTSASAERDLTVATADDERAYVGYDSPDEVTIVTDGNVTNASAANRTETVTLVTVTNRFGVEVDVPGVDIEERPDGLNVSVRPLPSDVSPGGSEAEAIAADLECEDAFQDEPLSVTVRLRGDGVEAVVFGDAESRTISVSCRSGS